MESVIKGQKKVRQISLLMQLTSCFNDFVLVKYDAFVLMADISGMSLIYGGYIDEPSNARYQRKRYHSQNRVSRTLI